MTEEQIKRRDELAEVLTKEIVDDGFWVGLGKDLETKFRAAILFFVHSAYRAGFADANAELTRKLEVAKKALNAVDKYMSNHGGGFKGALVESKVYTALKEIE